MRRASANQEIHIADTKNELGPLFKKHCKVWKKENVPEAIQFLRDEIERRTILFAETSEEFEWPVQNLEDYTELTGTDLPIITFVVEEWGVLKQMYNVNIISELLMLGRSSGVFVMVLAQYLNAKAMPRETSINFHHRILFGRFDRPSAGIMFGTVEKEFVAEAIKFVGKPGRAILETGGELSLAQIPEIGKDMLSKWM